MDFKVEKKGVKQVNNLVTRFPAVVKRANLSALSATGFYVRHELKNHIEFGGIKPKLHPITANLIYGSKGWRKRNANLAPVPFYKLGTMAGYYLDKNRGMIRVSLGISKKKPRNKAAEELIKRHQQGYSKTLTKEGRRRINKALIKLGKKPLRKTTTTLRVPRRVIISPVMNKVKGVVPKLYEDRFDRAIERYTTGRDTKTSRIGL